MHVQDNHPVQRGKQGKSKIQNQVSQSLHISCDEGVADNAEGWRMQQPRFRTCFFVVSSPSAPWHGARQLEALRLGTMPVARVGAKHSALGVEEGDWGADAHSPHCRPRCLNHKHCGCCSCRWCSGRSHHRNHCRTCRRCHHHRHHHRHHRRRCWHSENGCREKGRGEDHCVCSTRRENAGARCRTRFRCWPR